MDKSRRHDKQPGVGVGGRLRQRLAQMLLRTSCTATTSATAFVGLATTNATATAASRQPAPPPAPLRARPRGRGAHTHEPRSSRAAVGDGSSGCQRRRSHHHRRRDSRALVHISIDCSAARSSVAAAAAVLQHSAPVPTTLSKRKGGESGSSKLPSRSLSCGYGWRSWSSSSSASHTDGEAAQFSSDGEGEEGPAGTARSSTIFSSRSLSISSDSAYDGGGGGGGGGTRPRRQKKKPSPPPRRAPMTRPSADADAFRPLAGEHRGKKKEERKPGDGSRCGCGNAMASSADAGGTAVVKRSRNPYADFRSSMAEMVAGRRIRGADALSELLVWYLSLNSPRHHPAILAAFEDVWEAVMGSGEP